MPLLFSQPLIFLLLIIPLLYSVICHEVAHGLVALWFGDTTAKRAGRITLNPLSHIDPVGALMILFVGFGWAKPVPVDYGRLRNFRVGIICVALAGVVTNIFLATLAIYLMQFSGVRENKIFYTILSVVAQINIILGAFNLIPLPPLDGSKVVYGFLSKEGQARFARLEPYGFPILIVLLFTGLLTPVIAFMQKIIYGFIALLV